MAVRLQMEALPVRPGARPRGKRWLHERLKRGLDLAGAGIGLAGLWPAGLLIGLLIKLEDGGPVFFGQVRVGQFGKLFRMWKFRTMVTDAEQKGLPLTNGADTRVTRIGRMLRRTKLDELPQLWNVLAGEMSLVGPRPEVPRYVECYSPSQREVLRYKPGITDLASLLFRNEEALFHGAEDLEPFYLRQCLPKKIELNRQYAEHANVLKDVGIILRTISPDWLGAALLYGIGLAASLWGACQLRFDFHMTHVEYAQFGRGLPWIVLPQLAALGAFGQLRSWLSCFGIPEFQRLAASLGVALMFHLGLWSCSGGHLAVAPSVALINGLLSLAVLAGIRMGFQFIRQRRSEEGRPARIHFRRVAIIGSSDVATRMALELTANQHGARRVVAFFDDNPSHWHKRPHNIPVVGMPECLLSPEWRDKVDEVVVAMPKIDPVRLRAIGRLLNQLSLKVTIASV